MQHKDMINKMTLKEKAALLSGKNEWETRAIDRLGIPSLFLADGPHGIRKQEGAGDHLGLNASLPATCFPTAATIANSWDEALGEAIGEALGEEAAAQGVNILLGPGLNIKRIPLCGRNFEYFSEDPYVSGKMAAAYIRGIQRKGVSACPKHFAVNNQEYMRMAVNAVVDERTLRELYLEGFEIAVTEGRAGAIMSSYNEVNGIYANENEHLLNDILRNEWGFEGIVVTDWGGSNDHVKGVYAGSDLEMPTTGYDSARQLVAAVQAGALPEERVDACVNRLLTTVERLQKPTSENTVLPELNWQAHHDLARKAARESMVLLKNENQILPLKPGQKVALIGDFAFQPRYQGAGSSVVNPVRLESLEQLIPSYDLNCIAMVRGYRRDGEPDEVLCREAVAAAEAADVVIVCIGLNELGETEGQDRRHMKIPQNQIDLLQALAGVNGQLAAVVSGGCALEMPWEKYCQAILYGYLCGQAGAGAILDLLTGVVNPSGKLCETFPLLYEDTPAYHYYPNQGRNAEYREALYVGYRYYETADVAVRYPFGYGLSYTSFEYKQLQIDPEGVSFVLTNTGSYDGAEVVQLYVGCPDGHVLRPVKTLKGFRKVFLRTGQSQTIRLLFDDKTFRYWNQITSRWEIENGQYKIYVGASVKDIRLDGVIKVTGTDAVLSYTTENLSDYARGRVRAISNADFERLLGHPIMPCDDSDELQMNDTLRQMARAKSRLARLVCRILNIIRQRGEKKGKPDLNILFICHMPFRAIAKMTGGLVSMEMVAGIVLAVNGHFFRGMKTVIGGFFANIRANRAYETELNQWRKKGEVRDE